MDIPSVPVLFMKPSTTLADPFPAPTVLPKAFAESKTADYESELAIVIGKDAKNVSEADALDYLLGSVPPSPPPPLLRTLALTSPGVCAASRRATTSRPARRSLRSRSGATPSRSTARARSARRSCTSPRSRASRSSRSAGSSTATRCSRASLSQSCLLSCPCGVRDADNCAFAATSSSRSPRSSRSSRRARPSPPARSSSPGKPSSLLCISSPKVY